VAKGPKIKRVDIKGRGRAGVKEHSTTRLSVILREGKTKEELQQKAMDKDLKQRLRASAMHGLWMAKEAQPKIINMGARRGWLI
jgi:large subunit ribosomal protein L22